MSEGIGLHCGSPALLGVKCLGKMECKLLAKRFKLESRSKSDSLDLRPLADPERVGLYLGVMT